MKNENCKESSDIHSRSFRRNVLLALMLAVPACAMAQKTSLNILESSLRCAAMNGKVFGPNGEAKVGLAFMQNELGIPLSSKYCGIDVAVADSGLKFKLSLPSEWNDKLVAVGGGGFDGIIVPPALAAAMGSPSIVEDGYAVMANNGGHDGLPLDASFASDPQKLKDYFDTAAHRSLPLAQEIIKAYYGKLPGRKYFEGCSKGGHEAMVEAQRHPEDFDGIVARSPAANFVGQVVNFNRIANQEDNLLNIPGHLDSAKRDLLAKAVLKKCDAMDGVTDGIISNPATCNFDPSVLQCKYSWGGSDCLTREQVATVNTITSPFATTNSVVSHAGYYFGGEDSSKGWGEYFVPTSNLPLYLPSSARVFSEGLIKSMVVQSPWVIAQAWDPNQWESRLAELNAMGGGAVNPDLGGMLKRKAKVVMWNGTIDSSVSAKDSSVYYDKVVATMGQEKTDQVLEFFPAPGVGHCGGGVGPDKVDLLKAVVTWVEEGKAPSQQKLVMRKDGSTLSRPMCKYPTYPRYKGSGDVNDAANFECKS